jgi:hypothetical protein
VIELTSNQLRQAANLKDQIAGLEKQLHALLGQSSASHKPAAKKSTMSAAGKAKIAAAQRARWAKVKGQKAVATPTKSKMSAATKAALSAKMKAYWAKRKAAQKK